MPASELFVAELAVEGRNRSFPGGLDLSASQDYLPTTGESHEISWQHLGQVARRAYNSSTYLLGALTQGLRGGGTQDGVRSWAGLF